METKQIYPSVPFAERSFFGVSFDGGAGWMQRDDENFPKAETEAMQQLVDQMNGLRQELVDAGAMGSLAVPGVGGVHTWDNWEAYWTDVEIGAPDVEKYQVEVPGRPGVLDLSEVLTGAPVFHNREVTITLTYPGSGAQWHEEYSDMLGQLHGQAVQMVMDSDPGYYYEGRCEVSSQRQDGVHSTFDIALDAYPYKKAIQDTLDDWLWDPFNFESGVVEELGNVVIPANTENFSITVHGSQMPCVLWMKNGAPVTIEGPEIATIVPIPSTSWRAITDIRETNSPRRSWLKDYDYTFTFHNKYGDETTAAIFLQRGRL